MGATYSVTLKIKMRNATKRSVGRRLYSWMKEQENPGNDMFGLGVDWCLGESRKAGIWPSSLAGACKIVLAFHQGDGKHSVEDGFDVFRSAFKATYSWGTLMEEAFWVMSWALEEGSSLEYWSDNDHALFEVGIDGRGHPVIWERTGR